MGDWLTFYTFVAFIAGVFLSAMVKGLVATVTSKAKGATAGGG